MRIGSDAMACLTNDRKTADPDLTHCRRNDRSPAVRGAVAVQKLPTKMLAPCAYRSFDHPARREADVCAADGRI